MGKPRSGRGRGRGRGSGGGDGRDRGRFASSSKYDKKAKRVHQRSIPMQTQAEASHSSQHQQRRRDNTKPSSYAGFQGPSDRFVDETHPQFSDILDACYDGFCVEGSETFDAKVSR